MNKADLMIVSSVGWVLGFVMTVLAIYFKAQADAWRELYWKELSGKLPTDELISLIRQTQKEDA